MAKESKKDLIKKRVKLGLSFLFDILGFIILVWGVLNNQSTIFAVGLILMIVGVLIFATSKNNFISPYHIIAMPWVFVDGSFHFFGRPEFIEGRAPDAVIARGLLDVGEGLPMWVHRIIGGVLILTTIYTFYLLRKKRKDPTLNSFEKFMVGLYNYVIAPLTIILVTLGLILNWFGIGIN